MERRSNLNYLPQSLFQLFRNILWKPFLLGSKWNRNQDFHLFLIYMLDFAIFVDAGPQSDMVQLSLHCCQKGLKNEKVHLPSETAITACLSTWTETLTWGAEAGWKIQRYDHCHLIKVAPATCSWLISSQSHAVRQKKIILPFEKLFSSF